MATPGNGMIDGLAPMLEGADIEALRGGMDGDIGEGRVGIAGDIGEGEGAFMPGSSGPVLTSVTRASARRVASFHSPHQSSSRTCGQTPSIMYDFALVGCSIGASRRHCPHCVTLPSLGLRFCRS